MNIGIIGSHGFIGSHLWSALRLTGRHQLYAAGRELTAEPEKLAALLRQCDVIIDAAGRSRGTDGGALYRENRQLADTIIAALPVCRRPCTVLFISTTHRKDLPYHRSKEEDARAFAAWAAASGNRAVILRTPNLFGPGMRPYHNGVTATFCALAAAGKEPEQLNPVRLELLSIHTFCRQVLELLEQLPENSKEISLTPEFTPSLPDVWDLLTKWSGRLRSGEFPEPSGRLEFLLLEQLLRHF